MLQYNDVETNGVTNIVCDNGSIVFWFAPQWSSLVTGPGGYGRLIELGAYTADASYGWWSLYLEPTGLWAHFGAQTNGAGTNYLSAPINWTSNQWRMIALTYSPSNSALYLDGQLATSGGGIAIFPGPDARTNGFTIGSERSGTNVANGQFESLVTFDYPVTAQWVTNMYSAMIQRYPGLAPGDGDSFQNTTDSGTCGLNRHHCGLRPDHHN